MLLTRALRRVASVRPAALRSASTAAAVQDATAAVVQKPPPDPKTVAQAFLSSVLKRPRGHGSFIHSTKIPSPSAPGGPERASSGAQTRQERAKSCDFFEKWARASQAQRQERRNQRRLLESKRREQRSSAEKEKREQHQKIVSMTPEQQMKWIRTGDTGK